MSFTVAGSELGSSLSVAGGPVLALVPAFAGARGDAREVSLCLVAVLGVGGVLVVCGVVGRQRGPVHTRVVESTVALVATVALHHEMAAHGPLGHVWRGREHRTNITTRPRGTQLYLNRGHGMRFETGAPGALQLR